jgi:hypothetical protein
MPDVRPGPRVQLPHWQGRFDTGTAGQGRPLATDDPGAVRVGRVTVFDADGDAILSTFGSPDRPSVVVFDGHLFDRRQHAAALGFGGRVPTDAELVAAGYATWGARVFQEFEGRYLVAIWDGERRVLLLGHDALGRHPAFYANGADGFWFGSNVLALASNGQVSKQLNRISLALGLLRYWPEAGETCFESVKRVRPGYYLEVTETGVCREHRYWDPFPEEDEPWLADEQALEAFEPALARAVERCMALEPRGIMLSGGIDSVTIAALAMKCVRERGLEPLVAVCGQTGYALSDAERMQTVVAGALSMPINISTTLEWRGGGQDVALSLDLAADLPSPAHVWWVGTYTSFYRRSAALGLNVLLTGSGGDNWLGVAERHAADLLRAGHFAEFVQFVRAEAGTGGSSLRNALRRLLWAHGLRPHLEAGWAKLAPGQKVAYHRRQWHARLPRWLCPDARDRSDLVERLLAARTPALAENGAAPRSHYRHLFKFLANPYLHHENETAFHIESWTGLLLLSPYHDPTLVRMFNRISPRLLLHGTRYKGLLRPVVGKYLPGLGLERQRKTYVPENRRRDLHGLRTGLVDAWPTAGFPCLAALGLIDDRLAAREIAKVAESDPNHLGRTFALLSHEGWVRAQETRAVRQVASEAQN